MSTTGVVRLMRSASVRAVEREPKPAAWCRHIWQDAECFGATPGAGSFSCGLKPDPLPDIPGSPLVAAIPAAPEGQPRAAGMAAIPRVQTVDGWPGYDEGS